MEEKSKHRAAAEKQEADALETIQADSVATFGRMAREASLAVGTTMEQALELEEKATS